MTAEYKTYSVQQKLERVRGGWPGAWDAFKDAWFGRHRMGFVHDVVFSVSGHVPVGGSISLGCVEVREENNG